MGDERDIAVVVPGSVSGYRWAQIVGEVDRLVASSYIGLNLNGGDSSGSCTAVFRLDNQGERQEAIQTIKDIVERLAPEQGIEVL